MIQTRKQLLNEGQIKSETVSIDSGSQGQLRNKERFKDENRRKIVNKKRRLKHRNLGSQHCCPKCPKQFKERAKLRLHLETHLDPSERKTQECKICGKSFLRLRNHLETHLDPSERETHDCNLCGKSYFKSTSLKEHKVAVHGEEGEKYPCPHKDCKYSKEKLHFASFARLNNHLTVFHLKKPSTCDKCGKTFRNPTHLNYHHTLGQICAKKAGTPLARPFACKETGCSSSFLRRYMLENHVKKVHDPERTDVLYDCGECGKSFGWKKAMGAHMVEAHGGIPCGFCGKRLMNFNSLAAHKKRVHVVGKEGRNFHCRWPDCEKTFLFEYEMKSHVKSVHKKEGYLTCYFCQERIVTLPALFAHMRGQHLNEFPWKCEECGWRTANKANWRKHMRRKHPEEEGEEVEEGPQLWLVKEEEEDVSDESCN